jgi:hypothetical protein
MRIVGDYLEMTDVGYGVGTGKVGGDSLEMWGGVKYVEIW